MQVLTLMVLWRQFTTILPAEGMPQESQTILDVHLA